MKQKKQAALQSLYTQQKKHIIEIHFGETEKCRSEADTYDNSWARKKDSKSNIYFFRESVAVSFMHFETKTKIKARPEKVVQISV